MSVSYRLIVTSTVITSLLNLGEFIQILCLISDIINKKLFLLLAKVVLSVD